MYGDKLFTIGITLKYGYGGGSTQYGWWAKVDFEDFGHCDCDSIHGSLSTKYIDNIQSAIDTIKADTEKLGIKFHGPMLFYVNDGNSKDYPPPEGWKELLKKEAERIGFKCPY